MKIESNPKKIVFFIAFSAYILTVLTLTVFRFDVLYDERQINLTLFADLVNVYRNVGVSRFLWLFLVNIGWFVPLGFMLPILLRKESFLVTVAIGLLFSFLIESLQFAFRRGVAELDDLVLNTLGAAIVYFFYKALFHRIRSMRDNARGN